MKLLKSSKVKNLFYIPLALVLIVLMIISWQDFISTVQSALNRTVAMASLFIFIVLGIVYWIAKRKKWELSLLNTLALLTGILIFLAGSSMEQERRIEAERIAQEQRIEEERRVQKREASKKREEENKKLDLVDLSIIENCLLAKAWVSGL